MESKLKRTGWIIVLVDTCFMIGLNIPYNYGSYILTDVAQVGVKAASGILTAANIIGLVAVLIISALMNNTRTRFGQFRPWLAGLVIFPAFGCVLFMLQVSNPAIALVSACIGYFLYIVSVTLSGAAKYNLYNSMAGDNSDARTLFSSRSWTGFNLGTLIGIICVEPLVYRIGATNEALGWIVTQLIFAVVATIGAFILLKISKEADMANLTIGTEAKEKTPVKEQIGSIIKNQPSIMVILMDFCRYIGGMLLILMVSYQTIYVYGDMKYMTYAVIAMCVGCIIGTILCPWVTSLLGGRKKCCRVYCFIMTILLVFMAFSPTSDTAWGFIVVYTIVYVFSAGTDALAIQLYGDAGEHYLRKTGQDARAFLIAIQNVPITAGTAVAGILVGVVLTQVGYETDVMITGDAATLLLRWITLTPAVSYALAGICLIIHNLSDKQVEEDMKANAEAGYSALDV